MLPAGSPNCARSAAVESPAGGGLNGTQNSEGHDDTDMDQMMLDDWTEQVTAFLLLACFNVILLAIGVIKMKEQTNALMAITGGLASLAIVLSKDPSQDL
mgnify:CR=1 FL=1